MFTNPDQVIDSVRAGFGGGRLLVVGDLMLDRYLWGDVRRISPEAPVPVLRLARETEVAGGAANVARNLVGLGLRVAIGGVAGTDAAGERLRALLAADGVETGAVVDAADRPTTTKTRVVGNHQQMLRIDAEVTDPIGLRVQDRLFAAVAQELEQVRALVLSDYAKGVLGGALCGRLIAAARSRGIPVLVDPKGADFDRYRGATLMTPNRAELALATGRPVDDLDGLLEAAARERGLLGVELLVLTLGELGLAIAGPDRGDAAVLRIPAVAREVFDVSGAGDTVIATIAAAMSVGLDALDAAHLANLAAGVVVGRVGTAAVTAADLQAAIGDERALEQAAKVCGLDAALVRVTEWRARGERVVFTNGCFDLLHVGHVSYLERAKRYGQRLVVGLNTDRSVRELKGPDRPVIGEADRARVLAALAAVDAVVLFDEPTPLRLIKALRPDVLAKGADYRPDQVVGAAEVRSWGGQLVLIDLVDDRSTSAIVGRLKPETEGR
jgi:D-beta-D-heptose 7-phosphate kinase/D-beta-D-heptose 1-phosphate adenosyltransferase